MSFVETHSNIIVLVMFPIISNYVSLGLIQCGWCEPSILLLISLFLLAPSARSICWKTGFRPSWAQSLSANYGVRLHGLKKVVFPLVVWSS